MADVARVVFLLVDGIGDVSVPELGDRTPLEVAHIPHLDAVAGETLVSRGSKPSMATSGQRHRRSNPSWAPPSPQSTSSLSDPSTVTTPFLLQSPYLIPNIHTHLVLDRLLIRFMV
jgi:hypothetical protein